MASTKEKSNYGFNNSLELSHSKFHRPPHNSEYQGSIRSPFSSLNTTEPEKFGDRVAPSHQHVPNRYHHGCFVSGPDSKSIGLVLYG